jgi:hypothetical protein
MASRGGSIVKRANTDQFWPSPSGRRGGAAFGSKAVFRWISDSTEGRMNWIIWLRGMISAPSSAFARLFSHEEGHNGGASMKEGTTSKRELRTIRAVFREPRRGPVTKETVQKLSRDTHLSRAAEIAKKYSS